MILNMAGGGGAGLNFSVKAYASELALPATAAENTIAVISDAAITDWVFAATEPTTRSDGTALSGGEVWLHNGLTSNAPANALKKNGIWLYPTSCSQYVGGAWSPKTAKTYQSGAWVEWRTFLYTPGDTHDDLTGGFHGVTRPYNGTGGDPPTIVFGVNYMQITRKGNGVAQTVDPVDLTNYNTLYIDGYVTNSTYSRYYIYNTASGNLNANDAREVNPPATRSRISMDISGLTGAKWIGLGLYSVANTGYIYEIELV